MHKKILIVGPSWVGDTVMAQSLFKFLKQKDDVILDVLAPEWTFSLLSRMPEVRNAISMPIEHGQLRIGERYQIGKKMRDSQYDQAIVLPNSLKSALIPFFAKIPIRTGWLGEFRYGLLNDIRYPNVKIKLFKRSKTKAPLVPMVKQYLALGIPKQQALPEVIPVPSFCVTKEAQTEVRAKFNLIVGANPVLAIAPGAEFGPAKRWPIAHFATVINHVLQKGWQIWLMGSAKDRPITDALMSLAEHRCRNLAGELNLAETVDILSQVSGAITHDSGLMHIVAAFDKPLLALYGPTSAAFTPPLSAKAQVIQEKLPCQPCFQRECPLGHHQCMQGLTPDRILSHVLRWAV